MPLTISQFAAAGDVGVETVRFYQRKGLLPVPDTGEGIRRYGEADVRRLRFIRMAQRAGFSLPVVDSDTLTVTYDSAFKLMADLRGMVAAEKEKEAAGAPL